MTTGPDADLLPAGVVTCDPMGRMTYLNRRMLDLLGSESSAPHLGRPFYGLMTAAGRIYFETHLRPMLMIEGSCREIALQLVSDDGARLRIYLNGSVERDADDNIVAFHLVCFESTDRQNYERELLRRRREAESFKAMVAASPDAIINVDAQGKILSWNPAAERLLGYVEDEVLEHKLSELILFDEQAMEIRDQRKEVAKGEKITTDTVRRAKDGSSVPVEVSIAQISDELGQFSGTIEILRDITERKRNEETIKVLNSEVMHRSKNLITVIISIAKMTARHTTPEDFVSVFAQRLGSLSKNLELLVERSWTAVNLHALVQQQLAHLGEEVLDRVKLDGPDVELTPPFAEAIGMAVFELSTNAIKYGALAHQGGAVNVTWSCEDDGQIHLVWEETGAKDVVAPDRSGFGSMLTGQLLEAAVSGEVSVDFRPDGLRWVCVFTP